LSPKFQMLETGLTSCRASVSGTQSRHPGVLKLVIALIIIISPVYSSESRRVCFICFIQNKTKTNTAGPRRANAVFHRLFRRRELSTSPGGAGCGAAHGAVCIIRAIVGTLLHGSERNISSTTRGTTAETRPFATPDF